MSDCFAEYGKALKLTQPGYPPEGLSPAGTFVTLYHSCLISFRVENTLNPHDFSIFFFHTVTTVCHSLRKKSAIRLKIYIRLPEMHF